MRPATAAPSWRLPAFSLWLDSAGEDSLSLPLPLPLALSLVLPAGTDVVAGLLDESVALAVSF